MLYYFWIFPWLLFASVMISRYGYYREEEVPGIENKKTRIQPMAAALVILPILLWAGFRNFWYADTGAYYTGFRSMPSTISGFFLYVASITKDRGFYIASAIIHLLTSNARIYFIIIALVQGTGLFYLFRKYSSDYILSLFLFVASTDIFSWMFNGIRQFVAVTIILFGTELYLNKKYVPAVALILFASLFHQSALLFIPMLFIAQGEAFNRKTLTFIGAAILATVFVAQFTDFLDTALEDTQYTNVVSDYISWDDDGTNPIRVLVYSMPTILALIGLKNIKAEKDKLISFCTNMSIVSSGLYLVSMFTSGIFLGRLPIYFSLYGYILLSWEVDHLFAENSRALVKTIIVVCYIGFYFYSLYM